jgi:single-strand DNA-binding protein
LVRDSDVRWTPKGKCCVRFSIITKDGKYAQWNRCVAWEEHAEKASRLKQGAFVELVGRLQTRGWDDPRTGGKRYTTEVVIRKLEVLAEPDPDGKNDGEMAGRAEIGDHEIPF